MQHPITHAESFAPVARIIDQTQPRMLHRILADNVCRIVGGTVVDHNDFHCPRVVLNIVRYLVERRADTSCLVVGRQDNAKSQGLQILRPSCCFRLLKAITDADTIVRDSTPPWRRLSWSIRMVIHGVRVRNDKR